MNSSVLARLGALLVAALPVAVAAPAPAAASGAAVRHEPGRVVIHTTTVDLGPNASPRLITAGCEGDERLIGGGYTATSTDVHVAYSYPSDQEGTPVTDGGEPRAWTVGAVNETKLPHEVQVSVACLAGGDLAVRVATATQTSPESRFTVTATCPAATVRAGGGYDSQWDRRLGRAGIVGSYPTPGRGWTLDAVLIPGDPDVRARATVTAYAICVSGRVGVADPAPTTLNLSPGVQVCTSPNEIFAASCTTPWTGFTQARCSSGQVLSGAGYRVSGGGLPGLYSVDVSTPANTAWTFGVSGSTATSTPISITVTPLCLDALAVDATAGGGGTGGIHADLVVLAVAGGGLLLLLLLAVLALRGSARRRRARSAPVPTAAGDGPAAQPLVPGLEVVVRAQRGSYGLSGFREKA